MYTTDNSIDNYNQTLLNKVVRRDRRGFIIALNSEIIKVNKFSLFEKNGDGFG